MHKENFQQTDKMQPFVERCWCSQNETIETGRQRKKVSATKNVYYQERERERADKKWPNNGNKDIQTAK